MTGHQRFDRDCFHAAAAVLLSVLAEAHTGAQPIRQPFWRITIDRPIEWVVPDHTRGWLLTADSIGRLNAIDVQRGEYLLSSPIKTTSGIRHVHLSPDGCWIAHDLTRLYSIALAERPLDGVNQTGLIWSVRAVDRQFAEAGDGDPEFDHRIETAVALGPDIIAVRTDGACVSLGMSKGLAQARWSLPGGDGTTLIAFDGPSGFIAALARDGPGLVGGAYRRAEGSAAPSFQRELIRIGDSRPMTTLAYSGGLVAAWPRRILRVPIVSGEFQAPVELNLPFNPPVHAASLAIREVHRTGGVSSKGDSREAPPLLIASDAGGEIHALEIETGRPAWSCRVPGLIHPRWQSINVFPSAIIAVTEDAAVVGMRPDSGELFLRPRLSRMIERVDDVWMTGPSLYIVGHADRGDRQRERHLMKADGRAPEDGGAGSDTTPILSFRFADSKGIRSLTLVKDYLVVVTAQEVLGYRAF